MEKMRKFLTPYSQNSPWGSTLKMTCFLAPYQHSAVRERSTDRLKTNNSNTVSFVADMTYASQNVMPFVSELRATGHGEVWDHTDEKKLQQFGWRCTNTESSYNTSTLIGNWNEQRFDINRISKPKPIPSQYNHYFETTYGSGYNTVDTNKVPESLKHLEAREPTAFPGHQPELDPPQLKRQYNSLLTTSRAAFGDPKPTQK